MAKNDETEATNTPEGQGDQNQRRVAINAQYIKDLSFENPESPQSLVAQKEQPKIDFSVNVAVKKLQETSFEVALQLQAKAGANDKNLFLVDLNYAAIFTLENIPEEEQETLLLVYCPNMIFPFARRVIADVTRDGGFPPLMIDPIDFMAIYQNRAQQSAEGEGNKEAEAS